MEISKDDWKLYRSKLPDWQEMYMEKLCEEYDTILRNSSINASDRFWALDKRMREDKRKPGVQIEVRRSTAFFDIAQLIGDGVITFDDLSEFSPELQEVINMLVRVDDDL